MSSPSGCASPDSSESDNREQGSGLEAGQTSQDGSRRPRNRPVMVCLTCHKRKVRCDYIWPECGPCRHKGEPCHWDSRVWSDDGHVTRPHRDRSRKGKKIVKTSDRPATTGVLTVGGKYVNPFCSDNSFFIILNRLQHVQGGICVPPRPIEELSRLHYLWKEFIFDWTPLQGYSHLAVSTMPTAHERTAFFNSFCALVGLAHAVVYMGRDYTASFIDVVCQVVFELAETAGSYIAEYDDEPVTPEIIGAFVLVCRILVYAPSTRLYDYPTLIAKLMQVFRARGLVSSLDLTDIHILSIVATASEWNVSPDQLLINFVEKLEERQRIWKGISPVQWTWPRLRSFTMTSILSTTFILSSFVLSGEVGASGRVPLEQLSPECSALLMQQLGELDSLRTLFPTVTVPASDSYNGAVQFNHITGCRIYLMNYLGMCSKDALVLQVRQVVDFLVGDSTLDHPFNAYLSASMQLILACAYELDAGYLEQRLQPWMPGSSSNTHPPLSTHGISLGQRLSMARDSEDGGAMFISAAPVSRKANGVCVELPERPHTVLQTARESVVLSDSTSGAEDPFLTYDGLVS